MASIGVSEVGAGSDVANIKTCARSDGQDYIVNGHKMWITNGLQADWMCCLCNTSEGAPGKSKSLIIIPLDSKGVERGPNLQKLGMRSSDTAQIFLNDVRVPKHYRIGEEGSGFKMQMTQFQEERLWGAANRIGAMEEAIAETVAYARVRTAFGRSILANQYVSFRIAELATELEALKALVYRATELYCSGADVRCV